MSILEKVRRWIDGETSELVLEEAARDAQVKPRSKAEEFIVKIARAIEKVMQDELVPLPQGTAIIPSEYMVFLNPEDDREWQGAKRKGLEQGLYHILAERAREIAGKKKLETKSFVIELRIDGTLDRGAVRVQPGWEDSSANKTGVLARPNLKGLETPPATQPPPPVNKTVTEPSVNPPVPTSASFRAMPTAADIPQATPVPAEDAEEMTRVGARSAELYKLEIWRGNLRQNVIPIYQKEIVIGRGSKTKPVDIPLSGDVEISRRHLILITDGAGSFFAINEGKNPAMLNDQELPIGQRVAVRPGVPIGVCSYLVRIQPQ